LQCLQSPEQANRDNLNKVRREISRTFRNKRREYMKDKINELLKQTVRTRISETYTGA